MKKIILILSILFITISISIQAQGITLSGKIVNNSQQPLEFVNVLLLNAKDSSLVKGNVTDVNGNYVLKNITPDNYLLSVRMIAYQEQYLSIKVKAGETNFKQKNIILLEDITNLETAVVTAQKPLYEQTIETAETQEFISRKENPIHFHVLKMDYNEAMTDKWKIEFGVRQIQLINYTFYLVLFPSKKP